MTSAGDESFPGHLRKLGLTKEGMKAQTELDAKRGGLMMTPKEFQVVRSNNVKKLTSNVVRDKLNIGRKGYNEPHKRLIYKSMPSGVMEAIAVEENLWNRFHTEFLKRSSDENLNELKDTPFKLADMIEEFNRSRIEQEHHGIPMPVIFEQNQTQNGGRRKRKRTRRKRRRKRRKTRRRKRRRRTRRKRTRRKRRRRKRKKH